MKKTNKAYTAPESGVLMLRTNVAFMSNILPTPDIHDEEEL